MSIRSWLRKVVREIAAGGYTRGTSSCRPCLEELESRLAPAADITILATGVGNLDHFLSATNGTISTTDDSGATNATLSKAALQSVGAGVSIDITADDSITFDDVGALNLKTGHNHDATFVADAGAISFNNTANTIVTQGGSLVFFAGSDLTASNLNSNGGNIFLDAGFGGSGNLDIQSVSAGATGVLTMDATGATSGNISQNTSSASALTINATATNNINFNAAVAATVNITSYTGAVDSSGSMPIRANSQLNLSAATGITVNTAAAGISAINSTSGNIFITQTATPALAMTIKGGGIVDQAPSGTVDVTNLGGGITVNGSGVLTSNGDVTLAARGLLINAPINSGSSQTTLANSVAGGKFNIGGNTPGTIDLTQAELDEITTASLAIGSPTAGTITISAAIASTAGWNTLTLIANAAIIEATSGSLTVPNLDISTSGVATLAGINNVGTLAGSPAGGLTFNDGPRLLTVGSVDGGSGVSTNDTEIHLIADALDITQPLNTASDSNGVVLLEPFTKSRSIDLGANASGQLGLTGADLNEITAGVLRIGSHSDTGNITVTAAISDAAAGWSVLSLISGGSISENGGALVASELAVQGAQGASLNTAGNDVIELAGATASAPFSFTDSTSMGIAAVDGVNEINAGKGAVTLNVNGAIFSASSAGQNDVVAASLTATGAGGIGNSGQSLKLAVGSVSADSTTGSNIFLAETGTARLFGAGLDAGSGTVILTKGAFALTANDQIAAASSVNLSGATLSLGAFADTIAALTLTSTGTLAGQINSFVAGNFASLTVNGAINLGSGHLVLTLGSSFHAPAVGTIVALIDNPSSTPVVGQFAGLPDNSTLAVGSHHFRLSYTGPGFDVTLNFRS
jgi:hypothetical protein